ncbi:aspartic proteinase nepenthesin-2-like [Chenopodium quinoa]|uniref:aspartic proteinase nepenthesin-2-like n=1 Tax=Chenopodium quinoa TaxID=63459 RepID=UPI000B79351C|nr:aspartic proteinase nepenthesin-2-like [Chenopodium quinoa]
MVELELGTFDPSSSHKTVYLGFDTGSDLIWTQCEGCDECFHQVDPNYPATQSYTYSELACSECPEEECVGKTCRVKVLYGDGAKVVAILARESLTFATTTDTPLTIEGVLFGCGIDMENFHEGDEENNRISGMFGMSYGKYSFQAQKTDLVKGKFQYCLQKKEAQELPPMYLRFGDDCIQPGTPSSIPMFRHENSDFYYLEARGIQVNQKNLELPPDVFDIKPDGTGGFLIDTGSTVTFLATKAFRVLVTELAAQIEAKNSNLERLSNSAARYEGFGLCYKRVREPTTFSLPWDILARYNGQVLDLFCSVLGYIGQVYLVRYNNARNIFKDSELFPFSQCNTNQTKRAVLGSVGRALVLTQQSASTVKCSNLPSTVGSLIPILF